MTARATRWRWVAGAVAVALAMVAGVLVVRRDGPSAPLPVTEAAAPTSTTEQSDVASPPATNLAGMTVTLTPYVPGPPIAEVGRAYAVVVQVSGVAPVIAVELWAGGDLVDVVRDDDRTDPTWSVRLRWAPTLEGTSMLVSRVSDIDGRSATSNPLALNVLASDISTAPVVVSQYTTEAGDTPLSLAEKLDLPLELILGSGQDPELEFEFDEIVGVPRLGLFDDLPPAVAADADQQSPQDAPISRAPIPLIDLVADTCRARISLEAAEVAGAVLVRAGPSDSSFEPVAVLAEAIGGTVSFADVPIGQGPQLLAVTSTVGSVRSTSPPVVVNGPDGCGGSWDGELHIENGVMLGVPDGFEQIFFFVGTGGTWQRIPAAGQEIVSRSGGGFNVGAEMPDLTGAGSIEIEVWGWSDGSAVEVGRSRFNPDGGFDPTVRTGRSRATSLSLITTSAGQLPEELSVDEWVANPGTHRFRWSTNVAGVTHGIWQVLTFAPGAGTSPMTAGVLAQGSVSGSGGTFELDIGAMFAIPRQQADLSTVLPAYADLAGSQGVSLIDDPIVDDGVDSLAFAEALNGSALTAATLTDLLYPPLANVHIRIIPMVADTWPGSASNNVLIRSSEPSFADLTAGLDLDSLDDPIDPSRLPYELQATIRPPTPPNPAYGNCWQFVKWDEAERATNFWDSDDYQWWDTFLIGLGENEPICPGVCYGGVRFGGGTCDTGGGIYIPFVSEVVSFGIQLWDLFVAATNAIKGLAVEIVVAATGCRAYASEAFCNGVAVLAINTALAFYGIPPTLPNSAQLKELAKGELKELVVEVAQDLGVPCTEVKAVTTATGTEQFSCDAIVDQALDAVDKEIGDFFAQAARQSAGIPFPPGAIVQPAPQGQTGPAIITATVTATAGAPQIGGMECKAQITLLSSWSPPDAVPFGAFIAALGARPNGSPVSLPNVNTGQSYSPSAADIWAVPRRAYDGFIAVQQVDLPTSDLSFTVAGPSPPRSRTYFPPLWSIEPVDATLIALKKPIGSDFYASPVWQAGYGTTVPYHALQLHPGAHFIAEIYSPCTGRYRYETPILGIPWTATGTFTKVS